PFVRTLFGNQLDLRTRRASLRSVRVGRRDEKLFHSIRTDAQHRAKRVAGLLLVHVNAIERDVGLVAATAGDVSVRSDGRLQAQQVRNVTSVERELRDLLGNEVVSKTAVLSVNKRL